MIAQSHNNWELIVLDNQSTDHTIMTVSAFNDSRIRLYQTEKLLPLGMARNLALSFVKGDFICFLDSDDIYHTTHLEEFKNLIKQKGSKRGLYFSGLSFGLYSEDFEEYDLTHKNNIEFVLLSVNGVEYT